MARVVVLLLTIILGFPRKPKQIVAYCRNIIKALTNNPHYPNPTPSLAALATLVDNLDKAESEMVKRGAGLKSTRDDALKAVKQGFGHLRDYVQGIIEALTADVLSIAESSGFPIRKRSSYTKLAQQIKDGLLSGTVDLIVKAAGKDAVYYWQFSLDNATWSNAPETMKASTTITGLQAGKTYYFRYRTLTRKGATDWTAGVPHPVR